MKRTASEIYSRSSQIDPPTPFRSGPKSSVPSWGEALTLHEESHSSKAFPVHGSGDRDVRISDGEKISISPQKEACILLEKGSGAHATVVIYVRSHGHIVGANQHMPLFQRQKTLRAKDTNFSSKHFKCHLICDHRPDIGMPSHITPQPKVDVSVVTTVCVVTSPKGTPWLKISETHQGLRALTQLYVTMMHIQSEAHGLHGRLWFSAITAAVKCAEEPGGKPMRPTL